ncbi:MAG: type IX secretion system protein PorQ [Bacteroidetes bacterium]|nr:type IX secretion system protein PorQ [Bacteroidota bacterium]
MVRFFGMILFMCVTSASAQTLGGNAVFSYLLQPNAAKLSSLGGVNISSIGNDLGMAYNNPALLRDDMHQQISTSFYSFAEGVQQLGFVNAYHHQKSNTNIALGVQYLSYGSITQTDPSGNILGVFKPADYTIQFMLSHIYKTNWWVGLTTKYINSSYGQYHATGLAFDWGIAYLNSNKLLQVSFLAKNMGTQLSTYVPAAPKEELPFDLQLGITKKLENAPFQFSLTAHHLQQFNILYNDPIFNNLEGDTRFNQKNTAQKIFTHLVFSSELILSDQLQINTGLNLMRRQSLNAYNMTNGLNGFTLGFGLHLNKLHIQYATGFYQQNLFHQFSLNFNLKGSKL